jgi:hypothetical protein
MAYLKVLTVDMFIHHMLSITLILSLLYTDLGCGLAVYAMFATEVSNPPMHARVMLRIIGKRYTIAYEIAEYLYFALFFIGRMGFGVRVTYLTWMCEPLIILSKILATGILV